ncbi:MAG: hypothetical protein ACR2ND_04165 [Solirubrobacteraceae bacterium]
MIRGMLRHPELTVTVADPARLATVLNARLPPPSPRGHGESADEL